MPTCRKRTTPSPGSDAHADELYIRGFEYIEAARVACLRYARIVTPLVRQILVDAGATSEANALPERELVERLRTWFDRQKMRRGTGMQAYLYIFNPYIPMRSNGAPDTDGLDELVLECKRREALGMLVRTVCEHSNAWCIGNHEGRYWATTP